MLALIQRLAHRMDLSQGELIRIAREVSEDGSLYSIHQLSEAQRERLVIFLVEIGKRTPVSV